MKKTGVVLLLSLFILAGCGVTMVKTRIKLPARTAELQEAKTIYLSPIAGSRGGAATRELRQKIVEGSLHTLVSTSSQANVVISGQALPDKFEHKLDEEKKDKCVKKNKKGKCTKKVKIPEYSLQEKCTVQIHGKAVEGGQILFERTFGGWESATATKENKHPRSQRNQLCKTAFDEAIEDFVWFTTPAMATVVITFHDVDDSGGLTDKAKDMVEMGNLGKAHELLEQVIADSSLDNEQQAWSRHNLARVLWAEGKFDECLQQVAQAERVLGSDEELRQIKTECQEYTQ